MTNNLSLITDPETAEEIQSEIIDGEKILWAGKPQNGPAISKKTLVNMPILLAVFVFMYYYVLIVPGKFHLTFWNFALAIVFLYTLFATFFGARLKRLKTSYGITKSMVIIKADDQFDTNFINDLSEISIVEYKNGKGTVVLGPNELKFYMLPGMYRLRGSNAPPPRLEYINNAREVYDLLISLNPRITGRQDKYFWF